MTASRVFLAGTSTFKDPQFAQQGVTVSYLSSGDAVIRSPKPTAYDDVVPFIWIRDKMQALPLGATVQDVINALSTF